MLALILLTFTHSNSVHGQITQQDKIEILKKVLWYKDCNRICVETSKLEEDIEVHKMLVSVNKNQRSLKRRIKDYHKKRVNYKLIANQIYNYTTDPSWNKIVRQLAYAVSDIDCKYKFSIMQPFELSDNEVIVIMSNYSYDKTHYDFDASIYFFTLEKRKNTWTITNTENQYGLLYDWKEK